MPLYYFDFTDGGKHTRDEYGSECADDQEARDEAVSILLDIARHELPAGDQHEFVTTVRNEAGVVIYRVTLSLSGRWWPGWK